MVSMTQRAIETLRPGTGHPELAARQESAAQDQINAPITRQENFRSDAARANIFNLSTIVALYGVSVLIPNMP